MQKIPASEEISHTTSRKQLKVRVVQRSVRLRKQVLFSSREDFDVCWAKNKGQQRGTFHPFLQTPTVSRTCFLKLYRFKFCSKNYFRKCFHGLCHPLQQYLHIRGETQQRQHATTLRSNLAFLGQLQGSLSFTEIKHLGIYLCRRFSAK